jgi:hypothetical protein
MPETIIPVMGPEQAFSATRPSDSEPQQSRQHTFLQKISSFQVLLGAILVTGVFVAERSIRLDPDTWWHIKVGSGILATHRFPVVDHYSFTARGAPWIAYEWFGDVIISLATRAGLLGTELLLVAGSSLITLLIYYYAWLKCKECKAAFLATVAVVPLAMLSMTVRPQLFGYAFLLATLICLERFRQGHHRALWVLPPVFLLWVNTHGSFVLGFVAIGLYWACGLLDFSWGSLHTDRWALGDRIRLELAALICVLMLPITPYGTRLATVPVDYTFSLPGIIADIQEWQPANFSQWQIKLFLALVLLFLVALLTLRPRYRLAETSFFIFAAYETCVHVRFAIVFAILFAPLLAALLERWVTPYNPAIDKYALNAVLILVMVITWVRYFPSRVDLEHEVAANFPVHAVRYLQQHPLSGRMLNSYGYGGYLIWAGEPANGVFIDGRADLYEHTGVLTDYRRIIGLAPDTQQLLRKYDIQSCLIEPGTPLTTFLAADSGWTRVYGDDLAELYVRGENPGRNSRDYSTVQTQSGGRD